MTSKDETSKVYVDNGDEPSIIGLEYVMLNRPWSGGEEPVVTAAQFSRFIEEWRNNDPNGQWGVVKVMNDGQVLVHQPNDATDDDDCNIFDRIGTSPAGEPLYAIEGWTFTTNEPNEEGR